MYSLPPISVLDQSSDSSTDSETHKLFPDIFTTMSKRGIFIDPAQMSPFPAESLTIPVAAFQAPAAFVEQKPVLSVNKQQISQRDPQKKLMKKRKESKRTLFSEQQRSTLMHWLKEHQSNPYPTSSEKQKLMEQTGLNRDQINVWFTNNRVRHGMSCSATHRNRGSHSKFFFH